MPSTPNCGHPNRKVFSHKRCKECATKEYIKKYDAKMRELRKWFPKKPSIQSELQKSLNTIYKVLRATLLPLHPACEANLGGCTKKATDIHHKAGRNRLRLILSKYFFYTCRNCHDWINIHSKESVELGYSLPRNAPLEFDFTEQELLLIEKYKIKVKSVSVYRKNVVNEPV